ncbi:ATP-binding protein [Palleronia caenipelagi]|uniref:ATP-binding protein n=1 Tax=Palleronia caenipelagi TaxID=2489174 RepID=UPI003CCC5C39
MEWQLVPMICCPRARPASDHSDKATDRRRDRRAAGALHPPANEDRVRHWSRTNADKCLTPHHKDFATLDYGAATVTQTQIEPFCTGQFTEEAHNLILMGGAGTGKDRAPFTPYRHRFGHHLDQQWQAGAVLQCR